MASVDYTASDDYFTKCLLHKAFKIMVIPKFVLTCDPLWYFVVVIMQQTPPHQYDPISVMSSLISALVTIAANLLSNQLPDLENSMEGKDEFYSTRLTEFRKVLTFLYDHLNMPLKGIIRGLNHAVKVGKPATPLQEQLHARREREQAHTATSTAAIRAMLDEGQHQPLRDEVMEPAHLMHELDAPDDGDDYPGAEPEDLNQFMPPPFEVELEVVNPVQARLRREQHLADCLAHENKWSWQYAIMLPTFLRCKMATSNWGNEDLWKNDLRPPCTCAMQTERDVDLWVRYAVPTKSFCEGLDESLDSHNPVILTSKGKIFLDPKIAEAKARFLENGPPIDWQNNCTVKNMIGSTQKFQGELQEAQASLARFEQANRAHTRQYFQEQWDRQRALQLNAINIRSKEKRARLEVLLKLEEDLLEARQQMRDLDAAHVPVRTAEQRNALLALPRTLVDLEQKIQEVADEVGNTELLNIRRHVRQRGIDQIKAVLTVQVTLGFLYEAKFGAYQQQVDAGRRTVRQMIGWGLDYEGRMERTKPNEADARVVEWNSIHSSLAKRTCRLWKQWDHGLLDVFHATKQYVEGSAENDGELIDRWEQMVSRTTQTWHEVLGVPIFWTDEDDEDARAEAEEEMDWVWHREHLEYW
ncbi:uncharacterized protein MELLADRAFT_59853 [Melampsora larici-populina 98AG31]|uniref:CxC1-like cysteine cluster associated with KDZ transposases domain-containing protein n=1 Tax=Melampsora larici-populina (strain 98AG31 / pathotype 3-4-7) TaxID=747676 RepID=F4R914_MELLP|nr:uncharacterized protein MELLADRAFT_59853 [Melampsora larici-populina 98AG31]EGG10907.1 hypothetical protein MELLADRAFT_59853 [Melampsora larici-populina 98AG31]